MPITLPARPPYYDNPKLEAAKAQQIQIAFETKLGWLDRAYHIAKVGIDSEKKLGYPQIHANNGTNEHFDIRADNKISSYCFFEIEREYELDIENDEVTYFLSAVFWNNLELVDAAKDYDFTSELIKDVTDVLKFYEASDFRVETRPENVFDKYSGITQELKQFLMKRFSGFKITFSVKDSYTDNCVGTPVDSCQLNIDRINNLPLSVKNCVLSEVCEGSEGGTVEIIDQDDNVIAEVEAPGQYQVIVFSGIQDNGPPYTNSIVDPG